MLETCTCGAVLVENARFCHRCGRPVGGESNLEPAAPAAEPGSAASAGVSAELSARKAPPVGFSNPIALRVAFLMSLALMVIQIIPGLNLLFLIWWLAAGFAGVMLYRRITGLDLSIRAGARLGSLTGILTFVSMTIVFALTMVFMGKDFLQEMVKQNPQVSEVINNPPAIAAVFLMVLVLIFAMVVGTCAAGGALGARFAGRDNTGARLS